MGAFFTFWGSDLHTKPPRWMRGTPNQDEEFKSRLALLEVLCTMLGGFFIGAFA